MRLEVTKAFVVGLALHSNTKVNKCVLKSDFTSNKDVIDLDFQKANNKEVLYQKDIVKRKDCFSIDHRFNNNEMSFQRLNKERDEPIFQHFNEKSIQLENKKMADLIFPEVDYEREFFQSKYPQRLLPKGAKVTRFAPSPTGALHIGGLYTSLISEIIAKGSGGVFYLRIEDTDKKREKVDGVEEIVDSLKAFDIGFDEGMVGNIAEKGSYGPYKQSLRKDIYQAFAKDLVKKGLAYPCFCTTSELQKIKELQEKNKDEIGYYGKWAIHRNISTKEVQKRIENGEKFVLRLKAPENKGNKINFEDLVKGKIILPQNAQDAVILKSDGIPTYHFAHVVDDHLMGTTSVIRGDEWLSSVPLHLQLYDALGWNPPDYAHISPILKQEGNSKRKLSKRKDPEAAVGFYQAEGIPVQAVKEYLLNIASPDFEAWRRANPKQSITKFQLDFKLMGGAGSVLDMNKLYSISRDAISKMTAKEVYVNTFYWARKYDRELAKKMFNNSNYYQKILNIERRNNKPRKDITKWSDVKDYSSFFFDEYFGKNIAFPEKYKREDIKDILSKFKDCYFVGDNRDIWFAKIKQIAEDSGFSTDMSSYKKNPSAFKGSIGDVTQIIRIAITGREKSPDLYEVMKVMGEKRCKKRLQ